jgi:hypothetical protein
MTTRRDREILRCLLRLRLVRTSGLHWLFPTARMARRRLAVLRERGLIASHARGLPGGAGVGLPAYWRLTEKGLALARESFAGEAVSDAFVQRAASASVRFFEHRDAVCEVYFALVRGDAGDGDGDGDIEAVRRRAERFAWSPEHDVVLAYPAGRDVQCDRCQADVRATMRALVHRCAACGATQRGKRHRIVPDATIATRRSRARVFLELDRATESHRRCKAALASYGRYVAGGDYAADFADEHRPYVLYATTTAMRRDNLHRALRRAAIPRELSYAVLTREEAVAWLREAIFGPADGGALGVDDVDESAPVGAAPSHEQRARLAAALRQLYDDMSGQLAGTDAAWPASMDEAAALLAELDCDG